MTHTSNPGTGETGTTPACTDQPALYDLQAQVPVRDSTLSKSTWLLKIKTKVNFQSLHPSTCSNTQAHVGMYACKQRHRRIDILCKYLKPECVPTLAIFISQLRNELRRTRIYQILGFDENYTKCLLILSAWLLENLFNELLLHFLFRNKTCYEIKDLQTHMNLM